MMISNNDKDLFKQKQYQLQQLQLKQNAPLKESQSNRQIQQSNTSPRFSNLKKINNGGQMQVSKKGDQEEVKPIDFNKINNPLYNFYHQAQNTQSNLSKNQSLIFSASQSPNCSFNKTPESKILESYRHTIQKDKQKNNIKGPALTTTSSKKLIKSKSLVKFMQLFRAKYDRNNQRNRKDIVAFTSIENRQRFLSEGRVEQPKHSRAVQEEIVNFRQEIEKRFEKNQTNAYVFPRVIDDLCEVSPPAERKVFTFNSSKVFENQKGMTLHKKSGSVKFKTLMNQNLAFTGAETSLKKIYSNIQRSESSKIFKKNNSERKIGTLNNRINQNVIGSQKLLFKTPIKEMPSQNQSLLKENQSEENLKDSVRSDYYCSNSKNQFPAAYSSMVNSPINSGSRIMQSSQVQTPKVGQKRVDVRKKSRRQPSQKQDHLMNTQQINGFSSSKQSFNQASTYKSTTKLINSSQTKLTHRIYQQELKPLVRPDQQKTTSLMFKINRDALLKKQKSSQLRSNNASTQRNDRNSTLDKKLVNSQSISSLKNNQTAQKSYRLATNRSTQKIIKDIKQLYGPYIHYMKVDLSNQQNNNGEMSSGVKKIPEKNKSVANKVML